MTEQQPKTVDASSEGYHWTVHENVDMCGQGDKELIHNWKEKYTIDQLKQLSIEKGYTAFSVSDSSFNFAGMKQFDYQLTPEECQPSQGYTNKIYILHRKGLKPASIP